MNFKTFFTILLIFAAFQANAQKPLVTENADTCKIVSASVANLKNMLQMTFEQWEDMLNKLGYGSKTNSMDNLSGRNVFLLKNLNTSGGVHTIIKTEVSVSIDVGGLKDPDALFKKLRDELRPYYKGIQGDSPVFLIKEGNVTYQYVIVKYDGGETVIMRRAKQLTPKG